MSTVPNSPGREDPETGQPLPAGVEGQPIASRRRRPDPLRRQLSAQIVAALDERRWEDVLDAAQELYAHEVAEDDTVRDVIQALRSIERRLRHGIYSTAVGDGSAVIMCACTWTVEKDSLPEARDEHRRHVRGGLR